MIKIIIAKKTLYKSPLRLCVDCSYYLPNPTTINKSLGRCLYFPVRENIVIDDVSGEITELDKSQKYRFCGQSRMLETLCGPSAKYFLKK
jgi:hypothetical protein